jgi:hypothetical protein
VLLNDGDAGSHKIITAPAGEKPEIAFTRGGIQHLTKRGNGWGGTVKVATPIHGPPSAKKVAAA